MNRPAEFTPSLRDGYGVPGEITTLALRNGRLTIPSGPADPQGRGVDTLWPVLERWQGEIAGRRLPTGLQPVGS